MGFGCQFEIGLSDGRLAESRESWVGIVETARRKRIRKATRRLFGEGEDTNASACQSTSPGRE